MIRAALILAALAAPAGAQVQCGPRDAVLRHLAQEYREGVTGRGLAADGRMVEILAGPQGTWTIIVTRPDGIACLAASGSGWEAVADILGEPG